MGLGEVLMQLLSPAVVWVFIPISAIVGGIYYSIQKEKIQAAKHTGVLPEDRALISDMLRKNRDLSQRVENLEAIITSLDKDLLSIKASDDADYQKKVKRLAELMKGEEKG